MKTMDPVVVRELPVIGQIFRDETWLEGERRGCGVSPKDPVVRENVCRVILRIGGELRERMVHERDETGTHNGDRSDGPAMA